MRTIDAMEKISVDHYSKFLKKHTHDIIQLLHMAKDKEFKWHLAIIISRLELNTEQLVSVWNRLKSWTLDKDESKIVRVNAIESLFFMSKRDTKLHKEFDAIIKKIESEQIPSIQARIRKLIKI